MATETGIEPAEKVTAPTTVLLLVVISASRSVSGLTAATILSSEVMAMADDRLAAAAPGCSRRPVRLRPAGGSAGGTR